MLDEIRECLPRGFMFQPVMAENVHDYARAQLALVSGTQRTASIQAKAMRNWLVASLLLLNGGAGVACHGAAIRSHHTLGLTLLFLSGLFAAGLNGWLIGEMVRRQTRFLGRAREYWCRVASDNLRIPAEEEALWRLSRKASAQALAIPVPALLSAAAWGWGYHWLFSAQG